MNISFESLNGDILASATKEYNGSIYIDHTPNATSEFIDIIYNLFKYLDSLYRYGAELKFSEGGQ